MTDKQVGENSVLLAQKLRNERTVLTYFTVLLIFGRGTRRSTATLAIGETA